MILQLAALSFAAPAMLLGIGAAAAPIVAHLLNRRSRRIIVFPTTRFLQHASSGQSRLIRLRRWLLLLLRCAAIVMIAAAFARPAWSGFHAQSGAPQGVTLTIIFDLGASMSQQPGGIAILPAAKAKAHRLIDQLTPGVDTANLIAADSHPRTTFPRPVPNLQSIHSAIESLAATADRADLPAALALAESQELDGRRQHRVVIVSDMQQTNWVDLDGSRSSFAVLPIRGAAASNIGLSNLAMRPGRPIVHLPAAFTATVSNFSDSPRTLIIQAAIDDRPLAIQKMDLKPLEARAASFPVTFDSPGSHVLSLSTADDDLPVDDQAWFTVEVVDHSRIAVISDEDPSSPASSAYYLLRALSPRSDGADALRAIHLTADQLTSIDPRRFDAVLIAETAAWPTSVIQKSQEYLATGGSLMIFCGDGPLTANLIALDRALGEKLPWLPGSPQSLPAHLPARLAEFAGDFWSDFLPQSAVSNQPAVMRRYSVGSPRADSQTILTYSDGVPAVSTAVITPAAGRVTLLNLSANPRFSDWAKHGLFVAMLHRLIDESRRGADPAPLAIVGQPFQFLLPNESSNFNQPFSAIGPGDDAVEIESESINGRIRLTLTRLKSPGLYRIRQGQRVIATAAAAVDPRESDLRTLSFSQYARRLSDATGKPAGISASASIDSQLQGRILWPHCLIAAMLLLAAESWLLGRRRPIA